MNAALARLRIEMFSAGQLFKGEDLEEFNSLMSDLVDCFPLAKLDAVEKAHQLAEEHNALLVKERDDARARIDQLEALTNQYDNALKSEITSHLASRSRLELELSLARSSLGAVPMPEHTRLISAVTELVGTVDGLIEEFGALMTSERRRELWTALEVVKQAVARG